MSKRIEFKMTDDDMGKLIEAVKPIPMIMLQCGTPLSTQERANAAWAELGARMGFDGMTALPVPGKSDLYFTAIATKDAPMTNPLPQPSDEAVSAALHARVPGGAEVWHWLPMDGDAPHETAHNVMRAALTAAYPELVARIAELEGELQAAKRLYTNAESQWRYMCEEISAAIGVNYDTPADAASAVRLVMQGAHVRDEQLSRLTAELAQRDEDRKKLARAMDALTWALGANGEFRRPRPMEGPHWWRGELAERACIYWNGKEYIHRPRAAIDRAAEGKPDG